MSARRTFESKKVAWYSDPEETAFSMGDMNKLIQLKVFRKTLEADVPMVLTSQTGPKTVEIPKYQYFGKDSTRVTRSAEYICRLVAKSEVKNSLSKRCSVQMSYANGAMTDNSTNILVIEFDWRS